MGKLDGKVALISGGARGQGAAEAETFTQEGAKVVFGDVRDAEGKRVEEAIRARGGEAVYVHLDVASRVARHQNQRGLVSDTFLDRSGNEVTVLLHSS